MDLESVVDELYELRPQDFTAARDERAAAARTAGERDLAARISKLRRPTLSAWASNLLVRRQPEQVQPLIGIGEGLRQAHQNLDGEQLRELSRKQHALVGALAREARRLAEGAGQPIGDQAQREIESTLHAVLADPGAAKEWAAGHLAKPLSAPVGFTEAVQTTVAPRKKPAAAPPGDTHERTASTESSPAEEQHRELDAARKDAESAEKAAQVLEREHEQAKAERERAEAGLREAEERVSALSRELKEAQAGQRTARDRAREARDGARTADREARAARRRAGSAAVRAERLAADTS